MENTRLTQLRQKHPQFIYERYSIDTEGSDLVLRFFYSLVPDISLNTSLRFKNIDQKRYAQLQSEVIQQLVFQIGIIEGFSYWKAACSPEFMIRAGYLKGEQIPFWQELLQKGMSEFFFVNQINGWEENFVRFTVDHPETEYSVDGTVLAERVFIPIGGGKDSVVSLEILKKSGGEWSTLTVNKNPQVDSVLSAGQVTRNVEIERVLDPQILELNQQGYLNGHTPFSAMLSFVATLAAYLYDYRYIAVSNEFSANEGNTVFLGQNINHQYSKSLEYEKNFRAYSQKYLTTSVQYFSFLRPLHEIQIAKLFAQYENYFPVFLSCNRGQKTGKWCGECPKCLFVYIMLAPFVTEQTLLSIFNKNLFEDPALQPILEELAGVVECKSLECVGTRDEVMMALALVLQQRQTSSLPVLLQYVKERIIQDPSQYQKQAQEFLTSFQTDHCLPSQFEQLLRTQLGT